MLAVALALLQWGADEGWAGQLGKVGRFQILQLCQIQSLGRKTTRFASPKQANPNPSLPSCNVKVQLQWSRLNPSHRLVLLLVQGAWLIHLLTSNSNFLTECPFQRSFALPCKKGRKFQPSHMPWAMWVDGLAEIDQEVSENMEALSNHRRITGTTLSNKHTRNKLASAFEKIYPVPPKTTDKRGWV